MQRTKLVAGNWKMHGTLAQNAALITGIKEAVDGLKDVSVAVCPPFPYLESVGKQLYGSRILLGAQNISEHPVGAFTGEVSGDMLKDFGVHYTLVGHSERRSLYDESDDIVAAKFKAAQVCGFTPVLCVGETLGEREANQTEAVLHRQVAAVIEHAGIAAFASAVVAYEPVWAIGTGKTATAQQAQDAHAAIRRQIAAEDTSIAAALLVLYGGSVKPENAQSIFAMPDVDGGLIGGASLNSEDFAAICQAAAPSV